MGNTHHLNYIRRQPYISDGVFLFRSKYAMIDFQKLIDLKKIREDIDNLKEYERGLAAPQIDDMSRIKEAYEVFIEILSDRDCSPNIESVTQRKKFIFIALYIFAPGVLIGDKMPKGFRKLLSDTLNIPGTLVSNNCDDIVFLYQNYRDFSADVENLYTEILQRLQSQKD